MIKIEKTEVFGWEAAIRGMRNPMNSWDKSDSNFSCEDCGGCYYENEKNTKEHDGVVDIWCSHSRLDIGKNDHKLMLKLAKGGSDHAKYLRMINVTFDLTAPLYFLKEWDTYKVGAVTNSCSTMHKIHSKEFTLDDFSHEHMFDTDNGWIKANDGSNYLSPLTFFEGIVCQLNVYREKFLSTKDKTWWHQMIQLLPSSYNQKRTVQLNYAVLKNMYHSRKNHKLDEWRVFCEWIKSLPHSELIIPEGEE